MHCGDNYEKDYLAALKFGSQAAIISHVPDTTTGFRDSLVNKSISPNHLIRTLEELSSLVEIQNDDMRNHRPNQG